MNSNINKLFNKIKNNSLCPFCNNLFDFTIAYCCKYEFSKSDDVFSFILKKNLDNIVFVYEDSFVIYPDNIYYYNMPEPTIESLLKTINKIRVFK